MNPAPALKSAKTSTWLTPLIVGVVVLGLGYWWVWYPLINPEDLKAQIQSLKESINRGQKSLTLLKNIQTEYEKINEIDRKKIALLVPQGEDLPNLLAQVDGFFKNSGFDLKNINIDSTGEVSSGGKNNNQLKDLQISATIEGGTYEKFKALVARAEKSIKMFKLTSFTLNTSSTGDSYLLNFTTPYLP